MDQESFDRFLALLAGFETAMLTTLHGRCELRSRPMRIAESTSEGRLWFITSVDSEKVEDMTQFPYVNVTLQRGRRFLSISGSARILRDPEKLRGLWTTDQRLWFEKGLDDPEVILLEITPTYAEYWDRDGVEGVRFALAEFRAWLRGRAMGDAEGAHGQIEFDD